MVIRFKYKTIVLLGILFFFLLAPIFFLLISLRPYNSHYSCVLPANFQCGLQGQLLDSNVSTIFGEFKDIVKKSDNYYISVVFPLKGKQLIQEDFLLPTKVNPQVGEYSFNSKGKITSIQSQSMDIKKIQAVLKKGNTIRIFLLLPGEKELSEAKQLVGNDKYLYCFNANHYFLQYVKNPKLVAKMAYLYEKYKSGCNPVVMDLGEYEKYN